MLAFLSTLIILTFFTLIFDNSSSSLYRPVAMVKQVKVRHSIWMDRIQPLWRLITFKYFFVNLKRGVEVLNKSIGQLAITVIFRLTRLQNKIVANTPVIGRK